MYFIFPLAPSNPFLENLVWVATQSLILYVLYVGSGDLSCQEKSEIVRVHNELRASVARGEVKSTATETATETGRKREEEENRQPEAKNMKELVSLAQICADQRWRKRQNFNFLFFSLTRHIFSSPFSHLQSKFQIGSLSYTPQPFLSEKEGNKSTKREESTF